MFVNKQGESYTILKKRRFKPDISILQYDLGHSYVIDISKESYSKGLDLFFYIDIKGTQLFFNNPKGKVISPVLINMVCKTKAIDKIISTFDPKGFKIKWGLYILLILVGGLAGFLIKGYIP